MKIYLLTALLVFSPLSAFAQETYDELAALLKAEVTEIKNERQDRILGTNAVATVQTVEARILEGKEKGKLVEFENDWMKLGVGDSIYLTHVRDLSGVDIYLLKDVNRERGLAALVVLFVAVLVAFGGRQGTRALLSLLISIGAIVFLLIPALLSGYDPALASLLIASLILAVVLFGTHGLHALSTIAFSGTILAVLATSAVAFVFVNGLRLSGYGSDASVYLNFATEGSLDLAGLLLGSIIIGVLGILDDVSITQASVVAELKSTNSRLTAYELYQHAIKVGRDHVGSLVNTLALAYVGAALPLILLFSTSNAPISFTLNQEVIAAELARIIIGSIGLILAVPLTTLIAAWWFGKHGVSSASIEARHHH